MSKPMKLENQFCFVVYALSKEIMKIYRPYLDEVGLTYTQYLVMIVLWEKDGIALKDLGKSLGLDSGTLTPLLKKLEKLGLVTRQRDSRDERNLIIHLTEAGRELIGKAESIPGEIKCKLPLKDEELTDLRKQLQEVIRLLKVSAL